MIAENENLGAIRATSSQLNGARKSAELRRNGGGLKHVATSDKEYSAPEMEFLVAIERYKEKTGRKYPTWTEVLGVVREIGYVKPM